MPTTPAWPPGSSTRRSRSAGHSGWPCSRRSPRAAPPTCLRAGRTGRRRWSRDSSSRSSSPRRCWPSERSSRPCCCGAATWRGSSPAMPLSFRHSLSDIATTEETSPALRADAARNRLRILAAAADVFAERGLDASTAEIARRAGVGEATLFRRFPSKHDLVVAILAERIDDVIATAEECLEEPEPWRAVERFFEAMVEQQVDDQGAFDAVKDK